MHEIIVLTDEEFDKRQKELDRQSFLKQLEQMSKSSASDFSVKNVKSKDSKPKEPKDPDDLSLHEYVNKPENSLDSDIQWDGFVTDLTEKALSPIETVTDENIYGFQVNLYDEEADSGKYDKYFKKEIAMLSEVLKEVKTQGIRVNSVIKKMTANNLSKKSGGVPKINSDMEEVYNSINDTKLKVIRDITALKTKQMDWAFKDKAAQGPSEQTVETIADNYYKNIINGGTKNFIQSAMGGYSQSNNFEYEPIEDSQADDVSDMDEIDPSTIDSVAMSTGFNITQPINSGRNTFNDDGIFGDEHGYIANEKTKYDICVYQYGENHFEFVALDEDGVPVPGIELPSDHDPSITNSLSIRPGSDYVYDKYGRKYRVIEQNGVDISDIDDMDYPFDTDEDKF